MLAATYSPTRKPCSTIGAGGLNFRVRDGTGWDPSALATNKLVKDEVCGHVVVRFLQSFCALFFKLKDISTERRRGKSIDTLVWVSYTHYCASTSHLSTSWSRTDLQGELILSGASHLDAFSGYPVRTWLLGDATGVTTDTPEVRPPRSSRTKGRCSQFS